MYLKVLLISLLRIIPHSKIIKRTIIKIICKTKSLLIKWVSHFFIK